MREGCEGFCQSKSTATFVKRGLPKRSVARNSPVGILPQHAQN
jgi:hypothetical protein